MVGAEVERAEKVAGWVRKVDGGGICDELGAVGGSRRWEQLDGAIIHDVVDRANGVSVPLGPPTARWMAEGVVRRVLEEEMDVVRTGRSGLVAVGVRVGESLVDADEVPTWACRAVGKVGNEKEFIATVGDGGCQSGGGDVKNGFLRR